jgi:hypothetical protein
MGVILSSGHKLKSSSIPQQFRVLPDGRSTAAGFSGFSAELLDLEWSSIPVPAGGA